MKNETSENRREFFRQASKIVPEWNAHLEIFSRIPRGALPYETDGDARRLP